MDLGIDLSIATLQEYALTQGITKKVSAMTQAEKVMLRYQYLLSVTKTQQGDFSRTSLSLANSLRTLRAYISAVTTQLGVGFAAALRHVVILLNSVMKKVLQLAQAFAAFMQSVFGKYEGGASGIAMDLEGAEDYADGLADSAGDVSTGLDNAADSAKELEKSLSVLPFDELNQLNKDVQANTSSGSGKDGTGDGIGIGDLGLGDAFGDLEEAIDDSPIPGAISKWIERIKMAFQAGNWFALGRDIANMFNEGLQYLYDLLDPQKVMEKVEPFISAFTAAFNAFVDIFDFNLLGKVIARGINDVAYIFNSWYEKMNFEHLGEKLAEGLNGLLTEGDFIAWGQALGNKFMVAWDIFKGFVSNEEMWANLGTALADGLRGLNNSIRLGDIGTALADLANGLCSALAEFADDAPWDDVVNNIANGINKFIGETEWSKNGKRVNKFITKLVDAIVGVLDQADWESLGSGIADMLREVKWLAHLRKVGSAIVRAIGNLLKGMFKKPDDEGFTWSDIGSTIAKGINSAVSSITSEDVANAISDFIDIVFDNLIGFLEDLDWEGLGTKFGELVKGINWNLVIADIITAIFDVVMGLDEFVKGFLYTTIVQPICNYFSEKIEYWKGLGFSVFDGFLLGLAEAAIDISVWIWNTIVKPFIDAWKSWFRIGGDGSSEKMKDPGKSVMQGFWDGLKEKFSEVLEWVAGIPEACKYILENPETWLDGVGSELIASYITGMNSKVPDQEKALYDMQNGTWTYFEDTATGTEPIGEKTTENYGTGIENSREENIYEPVQATVDHVDGLMEAATKLAEGRSKESAYAYGHGYENTQELDANLAKTNALVTGALGGIMDSAPKYADETITRYGNGYANTAILHNNLNTTEDLVHKMAEDNKTTARQKGSETIEDYGNSFSFMSTLVSNLQTVANVVANKFEEIRQMAIGVGTNTRNGLINGLKTHTTGLESYIDEAEGVVSGLASSVRDTLDLDLWEAGYNGMNSFAGGMRDASNNIRLPHFDVSWIDYGIMSVPHINVNWYAKGGYFKGGNGQLIGIAENGKDEAVLPLENRRAMSMIADSIVSASNGMGLDTQDLADAIVEAMVTVNAGQQDPIFHIEVKTEDDEVLARAVTRGQRSIDYRNNPTPRFAY